MTVTPVRTLSPSTRVWVPTSTPGTSVMALRGPGVPRYFSPTERARGLPVGVARCGSCSAGVVVMGVRVTGWVLAACGWRAWLVLLGPCLLAGRTVVLLRCRGDRVRHMAAEPVC